MRETVPLSRTFEKSSLRTPPRHDSGEDTSAPTQEWVIAFLLVIFEASLLVVGLSLYKGLTTTTRVLFGGVVGLIGAIFSSAYLARLYLLGSASERRMFSFIIAMNLVMLLAITFVGEVVVRLNIKPNSQGVEVFGTTLLPKDWRVVSEWNQRLLRKSSESISSFEADDWLGWTLAPNRVSHDGLYMSSREGIRSQAVGVTYKKEPRKPYRIAVVGDSFTFGEGVPFESTWAAYLDNQLGKTVELLNFGVGGYGIDQAYLRYHRDAKGFHPSMVILAFIEWDLLRAMHVYPFIGIPQWQVPFVKPRFAIRNQNLELVNVPLIPITKLLDLPTVMSLPHLEYERGYVAEEWEHYWYHSSAFLRYVLSLLPRSMAASPLTSEAAEMAVNVEVLGRFFREVEADGAIPLIVYLPSRSDFRGEERKAKDTIFRELQAKGIPFEDLSACMKHADHTKLFLQGDPHYSPEGNALTAACLKPIIEKRLHLSDSRQTE